MTRSRAHVELSTTNRSSFFLVAPNRRLATAKASPSRTTVDTAMRTPLQLAPAPSAAANVSFVRGA